MTTKPLILSTTDTHMNTNSSCLGLCLVIAWLGDPGNVFDVKLLAFFKIQVQVFVLWRIHDEEAKGLILSADFGGMFHQAGFIDDAHFETDVDSNSEESS